MKDLLYIDPGQLGGGVILFLLALYFLPAIIAALRGKTNTMAIFALNLFLGWTLIGWIVSLVWSLTADPRPAHPVVVNNLVAQERRPDPAVQQVHARPMDIHLRSVDDSNNLSSKERIEQLVQLKRLLDEQVLTQEEFDKEKMKILGN